MSALVAEGLPVFPVGPTGPTGPTPLPDEAARVVRRRRKSKQSTASSQEAAQYRIAKKYQVGTLLKFAVKFET